MQSSRGDVCGFSNCILIRASGRSCEERSFGEVAHSSLLAWRGSAQLNSLMSKVAAQFI
jgi:hypothetical protein